LVIPDLARWEDWSQIDRMAKLFKEADDNSSWVRVPVVNYLRACPLPEAKTTLAELEKIDPKAVKRAATFFPIPQPAAPQPAAPPAAATQPAAGLLKTKPMVLATGLDSTTVGSIAPVAAAIGSGQTVISSVERAATPASKNETSIFSARPVDSQVPIMRMPLGARSPVAFRTQLSRTGDSVAARTQDRGRIFITATQAVSPDLIMGVTQGVTIARPLELCAAALLSATTLLLFMWMILAGQPQRNSTRLHRGWAFAHRWTHGNSKSGVNEDIGNSV